MFAEMIRLFHERSDFFLQLTLEHIAIALVAIVLAIVLGGAVLGVLAEAFAPAKARRPLASAAGARLFERCAESRSTVIECYACCCR